MPIFCREEIQNKINENSRFINKKDLEEQVKNLHAQDKNSIATEWEIVTMNALSKIGKVNYEKEQEGSTKPDIFFKSQDKNYEFLADVTAISNEGDEKKNPLDYFIKSLREYFKKNNLTLDGLHLQFTASKSGKFKNQIQTIDIPSNNETHEFIKKEFQQVIQLMKEEHKSFNIVLNNPYLIEVSYNSNKGFTFGHPSYKTTYSLRKNPLYNRLKMKTKQLKESKYIGITGIFICDGGFEMLSPCFDNQQPIPTKEIVEDFFTLNNSISFIYIINIEEEYNIFTPITSKKINCWAFFNENNKYIKKELISDIENLHTLLPTPQSTPVNVLSKMVYNKKNGINENYFSVPVEWNIP